MGSAVATTGSPACTIEADTDRVIEGSVKATATLKVTGNASGSTRVRIREDVTTGAQSKTSTLSATGGTVTLLTDGNGFGGYQRYFLTGDVYDSKGNTVATCSDEYTVVKGTPMGCYIPTINPVSSAQDVRYYLKSVGTDSDSGTLTIYEPNNPRPDVDHRRATFDSSATYTVNSEGIYRIEAYSDKAYPCYRDIQFGANPIYAPELTHQPLNLLSAAPDAEYTKLRNSLSTSITNLGVNGSDSESGFGAIAWLLGEDRRGDIQINAGDLAVFVIISDADNASSISAPFARMTAQKFAGTQTTGGSAPVTVVSYSTNLTRSGAIKTNLSYSYRKTVTDAETGTTSTVTVSESTPNIYPSTYGYPSCSGSNPVTSNTCTSALMAGKNGTSWSCSWTCTAGTDLNGATGYTDGAAGAETRDYCSTPYGGYSNIAAYLAATACSSPFACQTATASGCTRSIGTAGGGGGTTRVVEGTFSPSEFAALTKAANGVESDISQNKLNLSQVIKNTPASTTSFSLNDLKTYADMKLGPQNYWFTFIVHDSATEKSLGMSCNTGEMEAVNYTAFAKSLPAGHSSIYPICATDYRPAVLDKTITPVINAVTRAFSVTPQGKEVVDRVVIQRANGTETTLATNQYTVATSDGATSVTVDPAVALSSSDRVVVVMRQQS